MRNIGKLILLWVVVMTTGCTGQTQTAIRRKAPADTLIKGNFIAASGLVFDSLAIDTFLRRRPEFKPYAADFKKLYGMHQYNYVWFDQHGVAEATRNLINHLGSQQSDGILKQFPYQSEFIKLTDQLQKPNLKLELLLTGEYFNYAKNVWGGAEVTKANDIGWYLPRKKLVYADLLQRQLSAGRDSVEQIAVIPQYIALKKALNRYPISAFKRLHGLQAGPELTAGFYKQLNVPLHQRIEQMIINLERMRWIPVDDHGGEFILVNIPEYQLHYYVGNKLSWNCRVVVGKVMTQTVIFSGHLQNVVFSPYWYVPQSIIQKEIKPGMARNANYLKNHNMEWNGGQVRQKPGKTNSLGLVKFIFPNSHSIYLHDTPSKPLFNEADRAFSHGCIRVAEPRELALKILRQMPQWTPARIDAAMHAGTERTVVLQNKIPVYIGYFTAFINSQGELNFRDDIYKRDARLLNFLMKD